MSDRETPSGPRAESNDGAIERAARSAAAEEIERRRRLGLPIVVWRDGAVVSVPADQIPPASPAAE